MPCVSWAFAYGCRPCLCASLGKSYGSGLVLSLRICAPSGALCRLCHSAGVVWRVACSSPSLVWEFCLASVGPLSCCASPSFLRGRVRAWDRLVTPYLCHAHPLASPILCSLSCMPCSLLVVNVAALRAAFHVLPTRSVAGGVSHRPHLDSVVSTFY